jgi:DNA repair exonuclease SbcCD ATPase subunit
MIFAMSEPCPTCGRMSEEAETEEVAESLERLEPIALKVLESQLESLDERIRQSASKLLLEWQRGKPKQQIQQTNDNVTVIRYESAAWIEAPAEVEHTPVLQLNP